MKIWHLIVTLWTICCLSTGCSNNGVTVKPENMSMVGIWAPNKFHSNAPPEWIKDDTTLILEIDGTCKVCNFGKGFFQGATSSDFTQGTRDVISGKWFIFKEASEWKVQFDFDVGKEKVRRVARLWNKGNTVFLEFWIGEPEPWPLINLQKINQKRENKDRR